MAPATVQSSCEGLSSQWTDTGKHHCPSTYFSPSYPTPVWKKKHPFKLHRGNSHSLQSWVLSCMQEWGSAGGWRQIFVARVNYSLIILLAPKSLFRDEGETSQTTKVHIYQGSSLALSERFLSKQPSNQSALALLPTSTGYVLNNQV